MSDSSSLSSPPLSDDEAQITMVIDPGAKRESLDSSDEAPKSPKRKRPTSPPHEEVLADNPDIPFIVAFRARFGSCFSSKLQDFGPQDIERGVVDTAPSPQVEDLLCALLSLVLNRKKNVERGHHGRALEEALLTHKSQWPRSWNGLNPLPGSKTFTDLNPAQRLNLLKTLILWSLNSSEAVSALIKESYKHRKNNDDSAVPLNVPRWGRDGEKRQYWLIEGQQDTSFRVYRESNPAQKKNTWWSVAGDLDELRSLADKLEADDSQYARQLGTRFKSSISRFEAGEEKRKRREYRQQRKAQFLRPEPGFSLYEGRTRGKRLKYTYSDDEADVSDATSTRRSTRVATPADPSKPVVTASGRQVRSRVGGAYGESMLSGQTINQPTLADGEYDGSELSDAPAKQHGRATRSGGSHQANGWGKGRKHIAGYNELDEMDEEEDAMSSGGEWDGGDDDEVDNHLDDNDDDDDDEVSSDAEDDSDRKSLVVKLFYRKGSTDNAQYQNGHNATYPSVVSNGTSTLATANGHLPDRKDDEDLDTIVVQQQAPSTQRTPRLTEGVTPTKPISQPISSSHLTPNEPSIRPTAPQQSTSDSIQKPSDFRSGFAAPVTAPSATSSLRPESAATATGGTPNSTSHSSGPDASTTGLGQ